MNPLARRLVALETRVAGRVRTFLLPREMDKAERGAWLAEQAPGLHPNDLVVLVRLRSEEGGRPLAPVAA